jgi:hypothetical protein
MRKVMFALAIMAMTATTASAQSSIMGGGGFAPCSICSSGGGQYYPPAQTARQKAAFRRDYRQVNGHAGGCDSLCQTKCKGAWRALGFRSVNACVARWGRLNAEGTAAACETAIKANGMRPIRGC